MFKNKKGNLRRFITFVILFFLCQLVTNSGHSTVIEDPTKKINSLLKKLSINPSSIGISVKRVSDEKAVAEHNGSKLFNPASNIKILTSYCALKNLGVNYRWQTKLFTKAEIENGIINGDMFIKGDGDPYMVSEKLWMFAKDLLNSGIKKISGNLILDSSAFKNESKDEQFINDYDRSFSAPASALAFNFNSITILIDYQGAGKPVKVTLDPSLDYFEIENTSTGVRDYKNAKPEISVVKMKNKTKVIVSGKWHGLSKRNHYRRVFHPELYYGYAFKRFFTQLGGNIAGKIQAGETPSNAKELITFKSKTLAECIKGMNKFSNNFMANQLVLSQVLRTGQVANYENGIKMLNKCFDSLNLRKKGNTISSASGLSRETRVSADQITKLLILTEKDFRIFPEFISSLPIYGDGGTAKKRSWPDDLKGNVRVKTGSLTNINTLSGYIKTKHAELLAFTILGNGSSGRDKLNYRLFQDKFIHYLYNNF